MMKFGQWVAKHRGLVLLLAFLLLIPSVIGYVETRVNYDILTYLPKDIDTMIGQDILMDQFGKGGFSMVVTHGIKGEQIADMADSFSNVPGVAQVLSYESLADAGIPAEFLPAELTDVFQKDDAHLMVVFFTGGTSSDDTLEAISEIRNIAGKQAMVGGMSAIIGDTRALCEQEEPIYVLLAVLLCCLVLAITMESFMLPLLFLLSIGMAIIYNLGSNLVMGEISYITKALAAVLQLGVTMDYSIFLWHSYREQLQVESDKESAMANAIAATFSSVFGSSMTTVAGFIALCFMTFTLGLDMGIVMAKGVVLGVICCITILPALILYCDKAIEKTTHRPLLPDVGRLSKGIIKGRWIFIALFIALLVPAIYGYSNAQVYYKLDSSLPEELECVQANDALSDSFGMGATHMLLVHTDVPQKNIKEMSKRMEQVEGVRFVLGIDSLLGEMIPSSFLPDSITSELQSDEYKLMLIGSEYQTASDEVNAQVDELYSIAKDCDNNSILLGEAPCTKDLIKITDHDFQIVSAVSILLVFIIIAVVLKSAVLPVLLVAVIEFAIFINMGIPYYTGTVLPFIASIVIGTIQLGATVDYAILMTNRYLIERKSGKDKCEAITIALSTSANSILVSALGFFAATFGVGLYSKVDLISALCALLARGALISMAVVLLILPSVLYVFDKLIVAATPSVKRAMRNKEEVIL